MPPEHPFAIAPPVIEVPEHGGGTRWFFVKQADRIRLIDLVIVMTRMDVKLVECALAQAGNESLPDSRTTACMQRMRRRIPLVEIAHHMDVARRRGPDRETGATLAPGIDQVRPELVINAVVAAFVE